MYSSEGVPQLESDICREYIISKAFDEVSTYKGVYPFFVGKI